jgi:hypothetical protein
MRPDVPWRMKIAFTLLETLVMMAALFVVTMIVLGMVKIKWPEVFGDKAAGIEAGVSVKS